MKIQLIEKQVSNPNEVIKISEELDRNYSHLTGIALLWTMGKRHTILDSSIDTKELFPKGMEAAFIQSNTYVNPNDRFFNIHRKADGNKLKMDIQEGGFAGQYPFQFKLYLRLENCD